MRHVCRCKLIVSVCNLLLAVQCLGGPATVYVDDNAPNDPAPGDNTESDPLEDGSLGHPFDSIQEAIDFVDTGAEIRVRQGLYFETIDFSGKDVCLVNIDLPGFATISGENANGPLVRFVSFESAAAVLDGFRLAGGRATHGAGILIEFANPTIRNCVIDFNDSVADGGGVHMTASAATFENCTFQSNESDSFFDNGGAIFASASASQLSGCSFISNQARHGGALCLTNFTSFIFADCTFEDNECESGGAVYIDSTCSATFDNCAFIENIAMTQGGALYLSGDTTIRDCTLDGNKGARGGAICAASSGIEVSITRTDFIGNQSTGNPDGGGAIYRGNLEVLESTFVSNTSDTDGGAVSSTNGSFVLCEFHSNYAVNHGGAVSGGGSSFDNCTFGSNRSDGAGGAVWRNSAIGEYSACLFIENASVLGSGIYNDGAGAFTTIKSCRFIGNTAGVSGGVFNDGADPKIINSIFLGNQAASFGAAIFNTNNARPDLTNCTIAGNMGFDGSAIHGFASGSVSEVNNCIIWGNDISSPSGQPINLANIYDSDVEGGWPDGARVIDVDPMFIDLDGADDVIGTIDDNPRLRPGSPCNDRGNSQAPDLAGIMTDIDGNPRIVDDPDAPDLGIGSSPFVDFGAYEYQGDSCLADLAPPIGVVNLFDLLQCLDNWGMSGPGANIAEPLDVVDLFDLLDLVAAWGPCE